MHKRVTPEARDPEHNRVADGAAVSAMLELLTDGVGGLPAAFERADEERRLRDDATREVLASPELRKAARQSPELAANIASVRDVLKRKDAAAEQSLTELRDATEEWLVALKRLRELG
ncbi:hypothetical protein [Microbacterium sp. SS28]|uniref:hypothetical protein n=1 Tax=Microbacterium sp. SS28 TaxID=2919948 RepID=UPI001FAA1D4D|nr:hypothetical protein [Microbacterium sp. SS28]